MSQQNMSPNYLLRVSAQGGLHEDVLRMIAAGADVNHEDVTGMPTLHAACMGGNPRCITSLLEAGADIEAEDSKGLTAVQLSVQEQRNLSAMVLLDAGADGSLPWPDGKNLLHWAVINGEERLIARAVRQGANINGRSRSAHTPIMLAAERKQAGCLKALLECGANPGHLKEIVLTPEISQIVSAWRARMASDGSAIDATA